MTPAQGAPERAQASRVVRLALAQVNPVVGDLPGNAKKVIDFLDRARAQGADLVAFPELVLTGYPPEDLLLRPEFIEQNQAALVVDGERFEWAKGDFLSIPPWALHETANGTVAKPALLLELNDLPAIQALGFYREEAG